MRCPLTNVSSDQQSQTITRTIYLHGRRVAGFVHPDLQDRSLLEMWKAHIQSLIAVRQQQTSQRGLEAMRMLSGGSTGMDTTLHILGIEAFSRLDSHWGAHGGRKAVDMSESQEPKSEMASNMDAILLEHMPAAVSMSPLSWMRPPLTLSSTSLRTLSL
ncbi:hypothetical protein A0H81_14648 [Grifola frondosa]|uniref:Uncharacterized protein n=1 Tax=Grifola frondosa TaxID=5627 RepID=A0A1C7LRD7_GRIFR|nr:hypothetical protein A0H81_14648 [Grifola frondosa]